MQKVLILLLIILLIWFMMPAPPRTIRVLPGAEPYKNEPSQIQFTNAEFKFYK
jgi:hypothetical protein